VEYGDDDLEAVLKALENTDAYLTAAVVSKDVQFQNKVCQYSILLTRFLFHFIFIILEFNIIDNGCGVGVGPHPQRHHL